MTLNNLKSIYAERQRDVTAQYSYLEKKPYYRHNKVVKPRITEMSVNGDIRN